MFHSEETEAQGGSVAATVTWQVDGCMNLQALAVWYREPLALASKSQWCVFASNSAVSEGTLVAQTQPWGEYLHHETVKHYTSRLVVLFGCFCLEEPVCLPAHQQISPIKSVVPKPECAEVIVGKVFSVCFSCFCCFNRDSQPLASGDSDSAILGWSLEISEKLSTRFWYSAQLWDPVAKSVILDLCSILGT